MSTNEPTDAEVIARTLIAINDRMTGGDRKGRQFIAPTAMLWIADEVAAALAAARVRPTDEVAETPVPSGEQCRACSGPMTRQDLAPDDDLALCRRHWNWWVARFLGSDDAPGVRAHLIKEAARPADEDVREALVDVLVMSPMADHIGTDLHPVERTADAVLAEFTVTRKAQP